MIQRKQTLFLLAAIIMTVICLCMQIGSFKAAGLEVARVYNLWFTDPLGKHHFDTWPLMAVLLPTAVIGTYAIFLYHNRKVQALFCLSKLPMPTNTQCWRQVLGHGFLPSHVACCPTGCCPHPLPDGPPRHQRRRETRPLHG